MKLFFVLTLLLFIARVAQAKPATASVTFYSHGSELTNGIPGTKHDIFYGSIFDGPQGLFAFRDGFFIHNNRFLRVRLPAGFHTFAASYGKKPQDRETLAINLLAGQDYFVLVQGSSTGVPGIFEVQHGRLELVPCEDAVEDMRTAKPVNEKGLWKYTKNHKELVVAETIPPGCPADPKTP